MQVCCPRCNHEWDYTGKAWKITCPSCRQLFNNVHREVQTTTKKPTDRAV